MVDDDVVVSSARQLELVPEVFAAQIGLQAAILRAASWSEWSWSVLLTRT